MLQAIARAMISVNILLANYVTWSEGTDLGLSVQVAWSPEASSLLRLEVRKG